MKAQKVFTFLNEEESIASIKDLNTIIKNGNKCFAILSAYKKGNTNEDNAVNTKKLQKVLSKYSEKVLPITGEWDHNIPEKSFFALKPDGEECSTFKNKIHKIASKFGQESYLYSKKGDIILYYLDGEVDDIGDDLNITKSYVGFKFE